MVVIMEGVGGPGNISYPAGHRRTWTIPPLHLDNSRMLFVSLGAPRRDGAGLARK